MNTKTTFVTVVSLLLTTTSIAQRYHVPDASFRAELTLKSIPLYGPNNDTIDANDVSNITILALSSSKIGNLTGIEAFKNLLQLDANGTDIDTIMDPFPRKVYKIMLREVNYLDLTTIDSLHTISIFGAKNIINFPPVTKQAALGGGRFYSIREFPDKMERLLFDAFNDSIPELPENLIWLQGGSFVKFKKLDHWPPGIRVIDVRDCPSIPTFPNSLRRLRLTDCVFKSLPNFPEGLEEADISFGFWQCLPVLPQSLYYLNLQGCTDIQCFPNFPNSFIFPFSNKYPLCRSASGCPVGYNIYGNIYLDSNANCIAEAKEDRVRGVKVTLMDSSMQTVGTQYSSRFGEYAFTANPGTYSLLADSANIPFVVSCAASPVTLATISSQDTLANIGLGCKGGYDAGVRAVNVSRHFQPGQESSLNILGGDMVKLWGTNDCPSTTGDVKVYVTGKVKCLGNGGTLTPSHVSSGGDTIEWKNINFGNVDPYTAFALRYETDTTATDSDVVCVKVTVTSGSGDMDTSNNHLEHCFNVANAYDPNAKEVSPPDTFTKDDLWLTYTVHFQNTGNAEAFNIKIRDTLDNNLLPETFTLLGFSHDVNTSLNNDGSIIFQFQNIHLPDSHANEPKSHGWVQYKIKRKGNLALGTSIHNTAYIYFDYNPAIVTNTATTTLGLNKRSGTTGGGGTKPSGVNSPQPAVNGITIYPNPANSLLNIVNLPTNTEVYIHDIAGKLLVQTRQAQVSVGSLARGMYILRAGNETLKFVKE